MARSEEHDTHREGALRALVFGSIDPCAVIVPVARPVMRSNPSVNTDAPCAWLRPRIGSPVILVR